MNTLAYALILISMVYLVFKILRSLKIRVDERLALGISPFVILGSSIRVLEDAGIFISPFFVTPWIYFLVFGLTFLSLLISRLIERRKGIPYHKILFISGIILLGPTLGIMGRSNLSSLVHVSSFLFPWILLLKIIPWSIENKIVTFLHTFDATITFVSINYFDYVEKHVLPSFIIDVTGTFSFVLLKFAIVVLTLLALDKFSEDKEFKNFLKLCIGILGASTGTRDLLRLIWFV